MRDRDAAMLDGADSAVCGFGHAVLRRVQIALGDMGPDPDISAAGGLRPAVIIQSLAGAAHLFEGFRHAEQRGAIIRLRRERGAIALFGGAVIADQIGVLCLFHG